MYSDVIKKRAVNLITSNVPSSTICTKKVPVKCKVRQWFYMFFEHSPLKPQNLFPLSKLRCWLATRSSRLVAVARVNSCAHSRVKFKVFSFFLFVFRYFPISHGPLCFQCFFLFRAPKFNGCLVVISELINWGRCWLFVFSVICLFMF